MTIPQVYHPSRTDTAAGFTMSAWVRPDRGCDGFIISKVSSSTALMTYYGLRLQVQSGRVVYLELRYSTTLLVRSFSLGFVNCYFGFFHVFTRHIKLDKLYL